MPRANASCRARRARLFSVAQRAGTGRVCEASAAVEDLAAQYSPAGTHGPLFCDVAYPRFAPGDIDDPTGATALSALRSGKQARARCRPWLGRRAWARVSVQDRVGP
jgi:hypothetical protein